MKDFALSWASEIVLPWLLHSFTKVMGKTLTISRCFCLTKRQDFSHRIVSIKHKNVFKLLDGLYSERIQMLCCENRKTILYSL